MELNREQAIDILERFDFFQGQRAGRELWNDKPFDVQEQDIANFSRDVALLKDYIKELTAENERLKSAEFTCGFVKPHKVLECPIFDEVEKAKADTVREFANRLIASKMIVNGIEVGVVPYFVINDIAKEMINNGTKEN